MEVEIINEDLDEIERNYDALGSWLANKFASPVAALFVLQTIIDAVDQARATINEEEED